MRKQLSLETLDRKYLWHPFTQQNEWAKKLFGSPAIINKGKGIYLYDSKGKKYMDGVSSLWANLHGHRHPELDSALQKQLKKIAHSTFLGLSHEPGIRLAEELIRAAPEGLRRVFFSDNGSTAVEVALKMAFQFQIQNSQLRTPRIQKAEFLALKNSYHGDTIGSVSLGGIALFHKKFSPLLFKTHFAMSPHCFRCPFKKVRSSEFRVASYSYRGEKPKPGDFRKETGCRWECLGEVKTILKKNSSKIAAAIIEPIVQGAGGMIVMPPGYLWGFAQLCKQHRILLIADEVAVGFGRTGKMFACDQENVRPDFLCLAKGISGGYLPLAATLTTEKIYRAFLGKFEEFKTFFHGHTYTANPLACAVSRANLKIFREQKTVNQVRRLAALFKKLLGELLTHPLVGQVRQAGLVAGVEIVQDKKTLKNFPVAAQVGKAICAQAKKQGLILRPLGDVIVLMPPLSIKAEELRSLMLHLKKTIEIFHLQEAKAAFPEKHGSGTSSLKARSHSRPLGDRQGSHHGRQ